MARYGNPHKTRIPTALGKASPTPLGFTTFFTGPAAVLTDYNARRSGNDRVPNNRVSSFFDGFRFVLCPSPDPESNWPGATTVNRTARGNGSVSSAANPFRVGHLRGLRSAPVEPQYVFGADTFCNPNGKPKAGTRYRWRCFLFADLEVVRLFSAEEVFVS